MLTKLSLGFIISTVASSAFAQTNIQSRTDSSAYAQDGRGVIARNPFGLCWRTGYWTQADAVTGCDGELAPPVAKFIAPPVVATAPPAPAVAKPTAPIRCDFTVTLQNDETFAFNNAMLSNAAKKRIATEVLDKLAACEKLDRIIVIGHTDRLGTQQYNQQLSNKRAETVAAYLQYKGVSAPIETRGAGKAQAIKTCNGKLPRKELIACLAPNRRVILEIYGTAK